MTQTAPHDTSRPQRRALRGLALSGSALALALACGGSTQEISSEGSGNSAGTDNNTGGSAAGASGMGPGGQPGGSNAGGSTGGSGADGGAGNSSGGTGAAIGGAAGSGGMSGDGGGASGGTAGSGGGAAGTAGVGGGAAGAGGSGGQSSGAVAEPGDTCSSPGALAGAGNHQRVTLICSGGSWQVNETCPENQACDTAAGFDQGTCKERLPECADRQPGEGAACDGPTTLMVCGPDNVTLEPRECVGACNQAACDDRPNHCPAEDFVNCGTDCRAPDEGCTSSFTTPPVCEGPIGVLWLDFELQQKWIVRIPDYESSCVDPDNPALRGFVVYVPY